jgi:sec-independent protein translocase protein TatA
MHLGGQELWIILGIVVLLFGAKKLPELGKSLGLGIKEFKKTSKTIMEDDDDEKPKESKKDTTDPAA